GPAVVGPFPCGLGQPSMDANFATSAVYPGPERWPFLNQDFVGHFDLGGRITSSAVDYQKASLGAGQNLENTVNLFSIRPERVEFVQLDAASGIWNAFSQRDEPKKDVT